MYLANIVVRLNPKFDFLGIFSISPRFRLSVFVAVIFEVISQLFTSTSVCFSNNISFALLTLNKCTTMIAQFLRSIGYLFNFRQSNSFWSSDLFNAWAVDFVLLELIGRFRIASRINFIRGWWKGGGSHIRALWIFFAAATHCLSAESDEGALLRYVIALKGLSTCQMVWRRIRSYAFVIFAAKVLSRTSVAISFHGSPFSVSGKFYCFTAQQTHQGSNHSFLTFRLVLQPSHFRCPVRSPSAATIALEGFVRRNLPQGLRFLLYLVLEGKIRESVGSESKLVMYVLHHNLS